MPRAIDQSFFASMCSHYQGLREPGHFERHFGVAPPGPTRHDLWPGYTGTFIRRHAHAGAGDDAVPAAEALAGQFGLLPHWARDTSVGKRTYNCRSESAAEKPSFRDAWLRQQRCIIPAEAIFEPDWRSGRARPTRISHVDGIPLGIAGLWSLWRGPGQAALLSFTMLTINAEAHPLMRQFHKPDEEKRMVAILPPRHYAAWLDGSIPAAECLRPFDADQLCASAPPPAQGSLL